MKRVILGIIFSLIIIFWFSLDYPFEFLKANLGDSNAQCNLGRYYYKGDGIEKDFAKAVEWYRKSAEQGYSEAQYNLGVCYAEGEGVKKDISEAVKWYRKSAEQGIPKRNTIWVFVTIKEKV